MASLTIIQSELDKASLLYHRPISDQALRIIAAEWHKTLAQIPDVLFVKAMQKHRTRSRFWPTEADILTAAEQVRGEEARSIMRRSLPEMTEADPGMIAMNIARADALVRKLRHKTAGAR